MTTTAERATGAPAATGSRYAVRNFIGGRWEPPSAAHTEPVYNPATGEVIAETPLSTAAEVDRAVQAAARAYPGWSSTPVVQRFFTENKVEVVRWFSRPEAARSLDALTEAGA